MGLPNLKESKKLTNEQFTLASLMLDYQYSWNMYHFALTMEQWIPLTKIPDFSPENSDSDQEEVGSKMKSDKLKWQGLKIGAGLSLRF